MSMNVFFQPYVGKDYTTGGLFGKRIMGWVRATTATRVALIAAI